MNDTELITREPLERHFAQVPDELITDHRLSHLAVRVWIRLDKYAGRDGQAFPNRKTLAADLHVSPGGIARALAELTKTGWIDRKPRSKGGSWMSTLNNRPRIAEYPVSDTSRGRLTSETGSTHIRVTEGHPLKDTQRSDIGQLDADSGQGPDSVASPLRDERVDEPTRLPRKPGKRKPLTKKAHAASWRQFRTMDLEDLATDKDTRGAAFLALIQEHGVYEPDKFAADMINRGEWAGFCERTNLGDDTDGLVWT